jgi:hypothetical protein
MRLEELEIEDKSNRCGFDDWVLDTSIDHDTTIYMEGVVLFYKKTLPKHNFEVSQGKFGSKSKS